MDVPGSRLDPVDKIHLSPGFALDEGIILTEDKVKRKHLFRQWWAMIVDADELLILFQTHKNDKTQALHL